MRTEGANGGRAEGAKWDAETRGREDAEIRRSEESLTRLEIRRPERTISRSPRLGLCVSPLRRFSPYLVPASPLPLFALLRNTAVFFSRQFGRPRSSVDRALASGARGRRFDSCRGYSDSKPFTTLIFPSVLFIRQAGNVWPEQRRPSRWSNSC